jgi:F-type H+-transporting ATPase subunit b
MSLDPLAQIHAVTIAAVVLIFLATLVVLRRVALVPVIAVMEQRATRIEAARSARAEADGLLENARREAGETLSAARAEAERMAERSRQDARERRSAALARAGREAEAILSRGRDEVQALRQAEDARLRAELYSCASQTLAKMLGTVDGAALRLMVNRVLEGTEAR